MTEKQMKQVKKAIAKLVDARVIISDLLDETDLVDDIQQYKDELDNMYRFIGVSMGKGENIQYMNVVELRKGKQIMKTKEMKFRTYCFDCEGYKDNTTRCMLTGEDVCANCQPTYCVKNHDKSSVECNYCQKWM